MRKPSARGALSRATLDLRSCQRFSANELPRPSSIAKVVVVVLVVVVLVALVVVLVVVLVAVVARIGQRWTVKRCG